MMKRRIVYTCALLACAASVAQAQQPELWQQQIMNSAAQLQAAQQHEQLIQEIRRQQRSQQWQQTMKSLRLANELRGIRNALEYPMAVAPVAVAPIAPVHPEMNATDRQAWDQFWRDWEAAAPKRERKGKACPFWRKACWSKRR